MRITLIENAYGLVAVGTRTLAAFLKREGHEVNTVLLPGDVDKLHMGAGYVYKLAPEITEGILEVCEGSALVGLSLMSNYFDRCVQITQAVQQRLHLPVIWGGIHATVKPEECLEHADMVCVGEGEHALAELCERIDTGRDLSDVANIWSRSEGGIVRNAPRPQVEDLDSLPAPDYSFQDQYVYDRDEGGVVPLTVHNAPKFFQRTTHPDMVGALHYTTLMSRGCPYACTYCCNNAFRKVYPKQRPIRRRSVEHMIAELKDIKAGLPFVRMIYFLDDEFYSQRLDKIEDLAAAYKREIGLPFYCLVNPNNFSEDKTEILTDAGLIKLEMGIQSASAETMRLYNRSYTAEKLRAAVEGIRRFSDRLQPDFDIILDNPLEQTEHVLESLQFMLTVKEPYELRLFSLVFFPGTDLYRTAVEKGVIADDVRDVYRKHFHAIGPCYVNVLFRLLAYKFPKPLVRILAHPSLVRLLNRPAVTTAMGALIRLAWVLRIVEPIRRYLPRARRRLALLLRRSDKSEDSPTSAAPSGQCGVDES